MTCLIIANHNPIMASQAPIHNQTMCGRLECIDRAGDTNLYRLFLVIAYTYLGTQEWW